MLLREIIYQHVFGAEQPVRLDVQAQVAQVAVPNGASARDLQDLVLATLYPRHTPPTTRMALAGAAQAKVAAMFEHRQRSYRVLRRADLESFRLQVKESSGWRDLAAGATAVEERLSQSLGRPDFEVFWALNLWRFERSPSEATSFDADSLDPKLREVVHKFRTARTVERIEDELKSLESRIAERGKELGQGIALEEKLAKAKARYAELEVTDLSEDDLKLLRDKDAVLREFDLQLTRLEEEEDRERREIERYVPDSPTRTPWFWIGVVIAVGSVGWAAMDAGMRAVALADILGLGMVAAVMFRYFDGMERASVHQVRLESIKRRINQVREDQVTTSEKVNHVLIHAGVRDAKEMAERLEKSEQLAEMIEKMTRRVEQLRRDASYVAAAEDVEKLRRRESELRAQRRDLPEDTLSSFQLESDLKQLGLDPATVLEESSVPADESGTQTSLGRLLAAAEATSQWDGDELYSKTRKMWGKIAGHVLGEKFADVAIAAGGALQVGDLTVEQIAMWRKTRPSEYEVLMRALALAIQVGAAERSRRGVFESLVLEDPVGYLTAAQVKKLQEVFASAAQKTGVIILGGA